MNINWISPLPPAKTGIAAYSKFVLQEFAKFANITVWVKQDNWEKSLENCVKVRHFTGAESREFNSADINIYHIGNNVDFHGWIWELSCQYPGIIILHDEFLHHFFSGYYLRLKKSPEDYQKVLDRYYPCSCDDIVEKLCMSLISLEEMDESYSITLHAIEKSLGVIVHTQAALQSIVKYKKLPIIMKELPYDISSTEQNKYEEKKPPYNIIIFGYIGSNRCIEASLRALAEFPKKELFRLHIYGTLWDDESIRNMIKRLSLNNIVTLHGYVDDDKLNDALINSDLALNLRYPSVGEVSYSQLQIWKHCVPSIVTYTGWYASLPDETVFFVRPGEEVNELQNYFEAFLVSPEMFYEKARAGNAYLKTNHSVHDYVQALLEFIPYAKRYSTSRVALMLVEKLYNMKIQSIPSLSNSVADRIYKMFVSNHK